jgi:Uma2 family endonuclease
MTPAAPLMTTEQLLELPDDGVERWLIRGQLREKNRPYHEVRHARALTRVATLLEGWSRGKADSRGTVHCGNVGCRLSRNPDTTIGIDAVYLPQPFKAIVVEDPTGLIGEPPLVAVEILSSDDAEWEINEKIDACRQAGVAVVWVIDPHDRTVLIYRAGAEPELVNVRQELTAESHLRGFRVAAAELFS